MHPRQPTSRGEAAANSLCLRGNPWQAEATSISLPRETHHEDAACPTLLCCSSSRSHGASADPLPTTPPESVGLSSERLQRITETLKADIAKGTIPGAVLLISRHGKIAYFEAMGSLDPEKKTPMTKDAIFRIYSMTKPITTVAAMMLFEEGKLALNDPVAKYIPAFKDVKVGEEKPGADGKPTLELVAPERADDRPGPDAPQLRAHLRLLRRRRRQEGLSRRPTSATAIPTPRSSSTASPSCRWSTIPGTTWDYSQSTDVLGRVIEVVTGKSLYQALKEMLLDPLGMTDTSFYVTDTAKQARIAEPFANDRTIGAGAEVNDPRVARKYEFGGGGLVGTATDYARFLQMLANGGSARRQALSEPQDARLHDLRPHGRRRQARALRPARPRLQVRPGLWRAHRHGLAPYAGSAGDYYWGGAGGTYFWVDPKEKMFVVYMMQSPSKRLATA